MLGPRRQTRRTKNEQRYDPRNDDISQRKSDGKRFPAAYPGEPRAAKPAVPMYTSSLDFGQAWRCGWDLRRWTFGAHWVRLPCTARYSPFCFHSCIIYRCKLGEGQPKPGRKGASRQMEAGVEADLAEMITKDTITLEATRLRAACPRRVVQSNAFHMYHYIHTPFAPADDPQGSIGICCVAGGTREPGTQSHPHGDQTAIQRHGPPRGLAGDHATSLE
ncbi:uncharacterized protein B0H64DRAFT_228747 [Chaetomium fimeti]|uniref:Uncharacterized protein n=1 Tax=Chaetomium fimeti TaxID=1854472 RepID=A0AAE0H9H5_9PEZI|nr:hypothetical protein B0H64DRAFT_228747 [Chaetomium fimeti]